MAKFTESDVIDIGSRTIDFLNRLSSDDALKARIKGLDKFDMEGLHGILGDEGISMTKDELGVAVGLIVKAVAPQAGAELSEDELEAVAGGKGDLGFTDFGNEYVDTVTSIPGAAEDAANTVGDAVTSGYNTVVNAFSGW